MRKPYSLSQQLLFFLFFLVANHQTSSLLVSRRCSLASAVARVSCRTSAARVAPPSLLTSRVAPPLLLASCFAPPSLLASRVSHRASVSARVSAAARTSAATRASALFIYFVFSWFGFIPRMIEGRLRACLNHIEMLRWMFNFLEWFTF